MKHAKRERERVALLEARVFSIASFVYKKCAVNLGLRFYGGLPCRITDFKSTP